jgi:hypothetical protein
VKLKDIINSRYLEQTNANADDISAAIGKDKHQKGSVGGLRLELALAIRMSCQAYPESILLALSDLLLSTLYRKAVAVSNQLTPSLFYQLIVQSVAQDLKLPNCDDGGDLSQDPFFSNISAVGGLGAYFSRDPDCCNLIRAGARLFRDIETLQLGGIWNQKPLLNGNELRVVSSIEIIII